MMTEVVQIRDVISSAIENTDGLQSWQAIVNIRPSDAQSTELDFKPFRVDASAQSIVPTAFMTQSWSTDVGWHAASNSEALQSSSVNGPLHIQVTTNGSSEIESQIADAKTNVDQQSTKAASIYKGSIVTPVDPRPTLSSSMKESSGQVQKPTDQIPEEKIPHTPLNELVAEVAHDIRAPIGIAKQIVDEISKHAKRTGKLGAGEVELLDVAQARLVEANRWAEGILVGRCLEQGTPIPIKRRFYPGQWLILAQPLLEAIASRKGCIIKWVGWDRSLPKVYLDENQLTRIMLNLVSNAVQACSYGDSVSIRIGVQNNVTHRIVLAIEDEGKGIDDNHIRSFNSGFKDLSPADSVGTGLGLRTAKALVSANGGNITVTKGQEAGTLVRISLPCDIPSSLVRTWLVENSKLLRHSDMELRIYAVKVAELDGNFCDSQMQQCVTESDFLYRIGQKRWIWMTLVNRSNENKSVPSLAKAISQIRSLRKHVLREPVAMHLAYRLSTLLASETAGQELTRKRISELTHLVVSQLARLIGEKVPRVDQLGIRPDGITFRTNYGTRQLRGDSPQDYSPAPNLLKRPRRRRSSPTHDSPARASVPEIQSTQPETNRISATHDAQDANVPVLARMPKSDDGADTFNRLPTLRSLASQFRTEQAAINSVHGPLHRRKQSASND